MIVLLSFSEKEMSLFTKSAHEMDIMEDVRYLNPSPGIDFEKLWARTARGGKMFPKVLILNLDSEEADWHDLIRSLKGHPTWKNIPVLGFGFLEDKSVVEEFYRLGGASCIRKPQTYKDLLQITQTAMRYWLGVSILPNRFLSAD